MGRRRFQSPRLQQTEGACPRWYCRFYRYVRGMDGEQQRIDARHYYGFVATMKPVAAKKAHLAFVEALNRNALEIETQATVGEWLAEFRTLHFPTLKRTTQRLYEKQIGRHIEPFFTGVKFCDLERTTIQRWVNTLIRAGLAYSTRVQVAGILRAVIATAEDAGLYEGPDLFRRLNYGPDRPVHEKRVLTPETLRQIAARADDQTRPMIFLAASTGLRFCELIALRWQDIDLNEHLIRVRQREYRGDVDTPKSKAGIREVGIHGLEPSLAELRGDGERVFSGKPSHYAHELKRAAKAAGIDWKGFGWHTLRRYYATRCNALGGSLTDFSRAMGHSRTAMTEAYIVETGNVAEMNLRIASEVIQ